MSPERKPRTGIIEADHVPVRPFQEITQDFIQRLRYSIYDSMASSAIEELKRIAEKTGNFPFLHPQNPGFQTLTQETQNRIRVCNAQIVLKSLSEVIDIARTEGRFDANWLYDSCSLLFGDAGTPNPVPKPRESSVDLSDEELERIREISETDPTNIRFLTVGLVNLPRAMQKEFSRLGIILLTIQGDLLPKLAEEMRRKGVLIPKTYGPRARKVEVILDDTEANQRLKEKLERQSELKDGWYLGDVKKDGLRSSRHPAPSHRMDHRKQRRSI